MFFPIFFTVLEMAVEETVNGWRKEEGATCSAQFAINGFALSTVAPATEVQRQIEGLVYQLYS